MKRNLSLIFVTNEVSLSSIISRRYYYCYTLGMAQEGNFSNRVQDVIRLSREEAIRLGHDYIGTEHLLLGIIREGEGIAVKILRNLGVDLYKIKKAIEDTVRSGGATLTI